MKPHRVLICRVGAMGDVLHALPAVAALRRARPGWRIDWAVDPRWAPLLAAFDHGEQGRAIAVDRVHLVETRLWSKAPLSMVTLRSIRRLRGDLRAENFDLAVDMQGTLRSAVIARISGAPARAGYSDPRESLAGAFYTQRLPRDGVHVVAQGAALLGQACGVALQPGAVHLAAELPHEAWADHWAETLIANRRICILAPGAGWGAKRWPPERFGALAQQLHAIGFTVMVNAPREHDFLASQVVAASAGAAQPVVCNVTALIALLRRSALLIGGDSGPLHLAAALGVPLVALFGPTDPARNGPWGPGPKIVLRDPASITSYKRTNALDPGLAHLGVAAVAEAISRFV
jgi:heptosyltransferase-1